MVLVEHATGDAGGLALRQAGQPGERAHHERQNPTFCPSNSHMINASEPLNQNMSQTGYASALSVACVGSSMTMHRVAQTMPTQSMPC